MKGKKTKINGIPGYGFPGEIGDAGDCGRNVFFSELKYSEFEVNKTENKRIIEFKNDPSRCVDLSNYKDIDIDNDDIIYISGNDGTTVHRFENINGKYYVSQEPMCTFNFGCIPTFMLSYTCTKNDSDTTIDFYIESDFTKCFDKILYNAYETKKSTYKTTIKDYNNSNSNTITVDNSTNPVFMYALYRISPLKYKKIFLGSITVS